MTAEKEQTKFDLTPCHTTTSGNGEVIDEQKLLRKLDWHLLPGLILVFLLCFSDRRNVGNARIEGLVVDLHIFGDQYLTTLSMFFVGYVLPEVPSNIVLKLTTPQFWLPTLALAWGTTLAMRQFKIPFRERS